MGRTTSDYFDIERMLAVLRRRWWVIALLTVLVAVATFAFSEHQQKKYTATASVVFENPQLNQQASGIQVSPTSPSEDPTIMATNVQLLTQQSGVAASTAREVGRGVTAAEVSRAISVSQQGQTSVVNVSAVTSSPALSAAIANAYVRQFISSQATQQRASVYRGLNLVERQIKALSNQELVGPNGQALLDRAESLRVLAQLQDGGAQLVQRAGVPTAPSSPKVTRNTALGLLLGLLLGISAAFILERLDRRIKSVEDLETTYSLPILSTVPYSKAYGTSRPGVGGRDDGTQEVFRLLRAYLRYFNVDREVRSLLVASAAPGEGKTTISRNLAHAAQETGTKTLFIDADMRRSELADWYHVAKSPGLSEVLSGSVQASDAVRSIPIATRVNGNTSEVSLDVLVAGHTPPNPAELIESRAMEQILSWACEHYELVVIDTPPLSVVSDAMSLLSKVDGVVVVSQIGRSTRDAAGVLRQRLVGVRAPLLGVVANGVRAKETAGYGYGYGYYGEGQSGVDAELAEQAGRFDTSRN